MDSRKTSAGLIGFLITGALFVGFLQAAPTAKPSKSEQHVTVPSGKYELDPLHSNLHWFVSHNGLSSYVGRFTEFSGSIELISNDIESSTIQMDIAPTSIHADYNEGYKTNNPQSEFSSWSEELARSDQFLASDRFPKISFTSTEIHRSGGRSAEVTGNLSFLGVTHSVTLYVVFNGETTRHPFKNAPAIGFSAKGHFNRSDFAMPGISSVSDRVEVAFSGEFIGPRWNSTSGN